MLQSSLFESSSAPVMALSSSRAARFFYRCADCLSVVTLDRQHQGATCGECGGVMEYMGRPQRDRLVKDDLLCPCDARCTHARGPVCDCRCGGDNHGSGILVPVTIDAGGVPIVQTHPGNMKYATHYRALVDAVRDAITSHYGAALVRKHNREYLDGETYRDACRGARLGDKLREAQAMRAHHTRNRRLEALLKEVRG